MLLHRELESFWLDAAVQDPAALTEALAPYPAEAMEAYQVSTLVNRVANDGPELAAPVGQETPGRGNDQVLQPLFSPFTG